MSEIRDLLERYRQGAELVSESVAGAMDTELDFKPAPGKWSARQLVAHLADGEAANVVRFKQVIAEDNPALVPWDQDAWAEKTDYNKRDPSLAIETIRILRASNYELLKDLPAECFSRTGKHLRRGTMSLLDMLRLFTEHLEKHCAQIRAARTEYQASQKQAV